MDAASVHWIYNNGIDYEEYDPLGQHQEEGDGPIHPENVHYADELPIQEAAHANPPDEEAQMELPDDQQSSSSSEDTIQVGSDEELDEEDIPLIGLENGDNGQSSNSSDLPEPSSDENLSYSPATDGEPFRIASDLSVEDGAAGGNINEAYEESSELSDFTASVEASGEAEAADPEADDEPENTESTSMVARQRQPGRDSPPPDQEDRAEVFLKLGCILSIFLIGCIAMIAMSIEGYLSYDFLIIGSIFFFVLVAITIILFLIVCYYADMDAIDRASGGGNRRREYRPRPDDPRAREFRYIPFIYRGP